MFYDPQVKTDTGLKNLVSLDGLIAWLEKQPPDSSYNWSNPSGCLIAQWLQAIHPSARFIGSSLTGSESFHYSIYGEPVNCEEFRHIACYGKPYFGDALQRARMEKQIAAHGVVRV